ncbi:vWA domain-containing protein [Rubripirellula reticaptiva]|uniref:von Willebrand factor type A domain protein n=1 Tax=Rubripirellula reticaptiva TaxID=2528013 RepID=A0A5C6EU32_9BACT|nr:VWA domain-containing protein [Rubripirellula reticaptiva]TWU51597.1 von Willebrand factor type A domain protein [Rubripirellula reticaptiva]
MKSISNQHRAGSAMVAVVILVSALFVVAAMVINLAHIQVVNAKVQIVADASARAAGRVYAETGNEAHALVAAQQLAAMNPIQSVVVPIEAGDLEYGLSTRNSKNKAYTFTAAENGNSVRVTTNAFANGSGTGVSTVFPAFGQGMEIRPARTATNTQSTLDVCLIVDRSGSMRYAANEDSRSGSRPASEPSGWSAGDPVAPNSRWLDLVASVNGFCDELSLTAKSEKIGLVSYASDVTREVDLTTDYSEISASNFAISSSYYNGMTNVGGGIEDGLLAVTHPKYARPWANNALVLMSDGNHNTGTDPLEAAASAASQQVPIYTVSFSDEADQVLMQQIADMTGGTHYHAVDAAQLNEAFRNIARRLPSMLTE